MKKLVFVFLVVFVSGAVFCQNVSDYFPLKAGYIWEYIGTNGKITDTFYCKEAVSQSALVYHDFLGIQTATIYASEANSIKEVVSVDMFGRSYTHHPALTIVTTPNKQWIEKNKEDIFECLSEAANVTTGDKKYEDCIKITKTLTGNGNLKIVKRYYYARGIGLVLQTIQGEDGVEKPFLRLSKTVFD
jgi:CRISPR/Cas system CSM-associated protein Csm5 (group 7 of RAMP superfamily)